MNCERFQEVSGDLARHDNPGKGPGSPARGLVMDANDRAGALEHIGECERCAHTLTEQNELSEWLGSLADQMSTLQAPADLETKLLAAHRSRTRVRSLRPQPRRRYWVTAAAAVLLVVLGLVGFLAWRRQTNSVPQPPAQANLNNVTALPSQQQKAEQPLLVPAGIQSATTSSSGSSAQPSTQVSNGPARKTIPPRRHFASSELAKRGKAKQPIAEQAVLVAANDQPAEVVTDFVSVGYGSAMDLQEGGQLVRVELVRSALTTFGLPMNMDRVDERVKADVLVGPDGLARAIRFVK